jgi:hypothetical protein
MLSGGSTLARLLTSNPGSTPKSEGWLYQKHVGARVSEGNSYEPRTAARGSHQRSLTVGSLVANRLEGLSLLRTEYVSPVREEILFVRAKDVGHLRPGPAPPFRREFGSPGPTRTEQQNVRPDVPRWRGPTVVPGQPRSRLEWRGGTGGARTAAGHPVPQPACREVTLCRRRCPQMSADVRV